jgi:hypothetical protein
VFPPAAPQRFAGSGSSGRDPAHVCNRQFRGLTDVNWCSASKFPPGAKKEKPWVYQNH